MIALNAQTQSAYAEPGVDGSGSVKKLFGLLAAGARKPRSHIRHNLPDLLLVERPFERRHIASEEVASVSDRPDQIFIDSRWQACQMDEQSGWWIERQPGVAVTAST